MTSSGKLMYESLFLLADPMAAEPYRLRSRLPGDAEAQGVDLNALSRGESQTKRPIQFDAAQGSKATNILWTQLVTPVCVSGRVIRILSENEVSGWSTYPVEVFDPGRRAVGGLPRPCRYRRGLRRRLQPQRGDNEAAASAPRQELRRIQRALLLMRINGMAAICSGWGVFASSWTR